ncbi:MAG: DUF4293 domain-containing protein [Mediterranea sp.]|jgi:hypothetical protein|nr:DUF4293 domain-containing protein [Mediterranea sp.]
MIQRIQSVYLLIATGLLITALCLPMGYFMDASGAQHVFKALGAQLADGHHNTWGLFAILLLSTIVDAFTIFAFRVRILQIRLTIFSSLLLVGYYIAFVAFFFVLKPDATSFRVGWALCLPLVGIILNVLALRAIGRDELMVKAADRLR